MIQLKPCPFHPAEGNGPYIDDTPEHDGCQVVCPWCGARGPTAGTHDDASNYWNDRSQPTPA